MNNNSNYIIYQKHIHISMFFILLEIMEDFYIDFYFLCIYVTLIYTASTFTFHLITLCNLIHFCKKIRACDILSSSTKFSSILFIAGVDYLKVKHDINH